MTPRKKPPSPSAPGVIQAGAVYRLDEALRRLGWGRKSFWHAERMGLRSVSFGRAKYLRGDEILRWFSEMEKLAAEGESDT